MAVKKIVFAAWVLFAVSAVWGQGDSQDQFSLFMDLFVARDGSVLLLGETNAEYAYLDLGVVSFPITGGVFSNATDKLTSKQGGNWTLSLSIGEGFVDGLISVYLPPGADVMGPLDPGTEIFEDKEGLVVAFYEFESGEFVVNYRLGSTPSLGLETYTVPVLFVAGVCILAVAGIKLLWPRLRILGRSRAPMSLDESKWDAIFPTLTERERAVLETIVKEGGRVSQRKLRHLCDLPKSTLSRVTDELQRKGLIRKIPVGQTNEIRLADRMVGPRE